MNRCELGLQLDWLRKNGSLTRVKGGANSTEQVETIKPTKIITSMMADKEGIEALILGCTELPLIIVICKAFYTLLFFMNHVYVPANIHLR
jgi:hypothetical protein